MKTSKNCFHIFFIDNVKSRQQANKQKIENQFSNRKVNLVSTYTISEQMQKDNDDNDCIFNNNYNKFI